MKYNQQKNQLLILLLIIILLTASMTGCSRKAENQNSPDPVTTEAIPDKPSEAATGETPDKSSETTTGKNPASSSDTAEAAAPDNSPLVIGQAGRAITLDFKPEFGQAGTAYVPMEVTPKVAAYTVSPDLSNIVNLDQFPNLTAEQKGRLVNNGFFAAPGHQEQLFYIYEENTYKKIPNFVTTDSVLQVYHIFYDYALRSAESMTLLPDMLRLNQNMLAQLKWEYETLSDPAVKAEAGKILGYFGVAGLAFGEKLPADFPAEIKTLVEEEWKLFEAAAGRMPSPLLGNEIDYSLFTPRGHYTRSEELEKYFKGMSWYGVVPYPFYEGDGRTPNTLSAIRAIITVTALCRLPAAEGSLLWENVYSPTAFFVGAADDVTPFQIAEIITKVYGAQPDLNQLTDQEKMAVFYEEIEKLPKPQINPKTAGEDVPAGLQFRFMGQRYIPDSEILQNLSAPIARPFPSGLDVFATFGSKRAADLIDQYVKPAEAWPEYQANFLQMKAKFAALPAATWQSNMYYAWLWAQNSLTGEYGEGYPAFMRNTAWQDKSLATALGSWAEMRHDTILYAKGSAAECGGFDNPPVVRAYVEPNVEFYNRLLWLTAYSRENLAARGILPENIEYACERFENMLSFLRDCVVKELNGEDLTAEEYDSLLTYGGLLENLTTSCIEEGADWYQIESETDRNMAVIADVHTASGTYLEEGVGSAAVIYVVVPMAGQLYLTRGAMFDYFEFVSEKRLTDEEWQGMLKESAPERPPFTASFLAGEEQEVPAPMEPYTTGC